jgi:hypothetical protein
MTSDRRYSLRSMASVALGEQTMAFDANVMPKGDPGARRNAVAVSLDATGAIRRFVLAGRADVYLDRASP